MLEKKQESTQAWWKEDHAALFSIPSSLEERTKSLAENSEEIRNLKTKKVGAFSEKSKLNREMLEMRWSCKDS